MFSQKLSLRNDRILQSKRRRLVFKTGVIKYIQNNIKITKNTFKLHIFISFIKLKLNLNIFCCCEFDR